jgi:hypothetical protein
MFSFPFAVKNLWQSPQCDFNKYTAWIQKCVKKDIFWLGGLGGGFVLMIDVLLVSGFINDLNNNHVYNL